ncbi:MAG: hypothetical protein MK102_11640 [Fuerstiella sp.]|nr:hypothetical protein [Fuerstiella sp.]
MRRFDVYLLSALLTVAGANQVIAQQTDDRPQGPSGQLSEENLGSVLEAIGLKPTKTEKRYDFGFKTSIQGEEWNFSMSAVLSRNEESLWVMAWLDQIPRTAAAVPRMALLKLLAANDRLGNGKFFAYIPSNKRFVLQRVVVNEKMTTRKLRTILQDLAISVADEYPTWATADWNPKKTSQRVANESSSGRSVPKNPDDPSRSRRIRASESATKFSVRSVN